MAPERDKEKVLERDVAGQYNTFRVYVYMMKAKKGTSREVYRALGMSSPSLALLHLEKLMNLGLVEKDYGTYTISTTQRIGVLKFFHLIGRWFVPRSFFYFLFFASMTVVFICLSYRNQSHVVPAAVALLSALINLYETLSFYRLLR